MNKNVYMEMISFIDKAQSISALDYNWCYSEIDNTLNIQIFLENERDFKNNQLFHVIQSMARYLRKHINGVIAVSLKQPSEQIRLQIDYLF